MRIIAGRFKGRNLATVKGHLIRPATDRARQTMFDILVHRLDLETCTVLDLFAGTGSIGIEALSRGAQHVTFVDNSKESVACIARNVAVIGCERSATIHRSNASLFLRQLKEQFDIIFVDPPYRYEQTSELCQTILSETLLKRDGYLIVEHPAMMQFKDIAYGRVTLEKRFGTTVLTFITHREG
jgi:16S rRNA (guanine966-N2)-methyltransferase